MSETTHQTTPQTTSLPYFSRYEQLALETADYPERGNNFVYPLLGLAGEAGESAEKGKKLWRNHGLMGFRGLTFDQTSDKMLASQAKIANLKLALKKELGDVLWYLAAAANECGWTLQEIAEDNIAKLQDRRERGVINSEGDNR